MPTPDQMMVQTFGQLLTVGKSNQNMITISEAIFLSMFRSIIHQEQLPEISMIDVHYLQLSFFHQSNWSSALILSKENKHLFDFLSYNYKIYYPARQQPNHLFLMDELPNLMVEVSRFTRYGSVIPPKLEPKKFYILWPGSKETVNKLRNTVDKYKRLYGISDESQNSIKRWRR